MRMPMLGYHSMGIHIIEEFLITHIEITFTLRKGTVISEAFNKNDPFSNVEKGSFLSK